MIMMLWPPLKTGVYHPDKILSTLCRSLVNRELFKVILQAAPFDEAFVKEKQKKVMDNIWH